MTITRPISLPIIYPPSITNVSIPGAGMNMAKVSDSHSTADSETPYRPRNASLDVPLLQMTLATLQEQVGLLTPPESVANGETRSGRQSRRDSESTAGTREAKEKLESLVDGMFDMVMSRIGQKVDITAFTDTVEALLMYGLHRHGSRLMLLSSPPRGKNDHHSWMLVAPGIKTSERKWKKRQSGAYDYTSVREVPLPPPRRPKVPSETQSRDVGSQRPPSVGQQISPLRFIKSDVHQTSTHTEHTAMPPVQTQRRSLGVAEAEAPPEAQSDLGEWQKLMAQRQQDIPAWQGHRGSLHSGSRTAPSTYLKSSETQRDSRPTEELRSDRPNGPQSRPRSGVFRPRPPTAYNGSPNAPSASSSGSLLAERLAESSQEPRQSMPPHEKAHRSNEGCAERVEYTNPARGFVMRVPAPSNPECSRSNGAVGPGITPTTMYYTAPTHPLSTGELRSGLPSTLYHTAPTHLSVPNGHMLFSHDHFDVPVAEERKDGKLSSLVSKITNRS